MQAFKIKPNFPTWLKRRGIKVHSVMDFNQKAEMISINGSEYFPYRNIRQTKFGYLHRLYLASH